MTAHLLQLALGPVQDLIERARRTRDLWFGSMLLSEISKAAARAVRGAGGQLIFPHHAANLEPDGDLSIANIIVAELPAGLQPPDVAKRAKEAVRRHWRDQFADPVYRQFEAVIRREIWQDQVNDLFECYATWAPFTKETYARQRQRLGRLMAGRKNCRDFAPAKGRAGVPKSSLDGLRETVLKDERIEPWPARTRRRLRVRPGEQLDVLGLVKRTASDDTDQRVAHRQYPSVSRIAADPWLRGVAATEEGRRRLASLRAVCAELRNVGMLNGIDQERYPQYREFPFEGTAVHVERHHDLIEETSEQEEQEEQRERLRPLRDALRQVEASARAVGLGAEPDPYVAVIVADGDRMGAAISELASPEEHRKFSGELARFAVEAARVVSDHQGVLVYSGGDDVLAFAPVDQALACARALYTAFAATMQEALKDSDMARPTLSVGVAIGHFMENLEDLLAYGRAAEKAAKKPDRDGLAVHLHKRGGAPIKVRKQWTDKLEERLTRYAEWFRNRAVSNRTPYELHRLALVYEGWPAESLQAAIVNDAVRVIEKKRPGGEIGEMKEIRATVEQRVSKPGDLRELAEELLIARQLAVALRQSGGQTP